jgi:hypothetical protein
MNIKATVNTTDGMIRIFLWDGANTKLFREIPVNATTKSATAHSFSHRVVFGEDGFALKSGWQLAVATEKAETFNVVTEGLSWEYPA